MLKMYRKRTSPNKSRKKGVIISHPGTHHAYQPALELQNVGMLKRFVIQFYYKEQGGFAKLIRLFPLKYTTTLQREFKRRRLDGLEDKLICSFPFEDLVLKILRTIGIDGIIPSFVNLQRNFQGLTRG